MVARVYQLVSFELDEFGAQGGLKSNEKMMESIKSPDFPRYINPQLRTPGGIGTAVI